MLKTPLLLLVLSASIAVAQINSSSITVTASQTANLAPDQALFTVSVQSGTNTGLNDILTALQGSGLTAANFSGVTTTTSSVGSSTTTFIVWNFTLAAPLTSTTATVAMLTTLQQNIAQQNPSLKLSFSIQGTQVSAQQQQSQPCSISDLLANAKSQAQTLANAGGLALGRIIAISGVGSNPPYCSITVSYAVSRVN